MSKKIDYTGLMQEIRDIFLDEGRTVVKDECWQDEDGWHTSYQLECTKEQEKEAVELIRNFFADGVTLIVEEIFNE
jgi:hypothetical protein